MFANSVHTQNDVDPKGSCLGENRFSEIANFAEIADIAEIDESGEIADIAENAG